ncbi:hypothetical protein [Pseudomonas sp. FEN]|uniref:hypothetical protein n=1 Tax=Pseudomonas sp. FEN TaxID=2767468 RepID=UPI001749DCB8|nr:hypothetical protein [Pseudomonas sp. FEN]
MKKVLPFNNARWVSQGLTLALKSKSLNKYLVTGETVSIDRCQTVENMHRPNALYFLQGDQKKAVYHNIE